MKLSRTFLFVIIFCLLNLSGFSVALGQNDKLPSAKNPSNCTDVVPYSELDRKPVLTHKQRAMYTQEAKDNLVYGVVILSVVVCRDGGISGIKVIRGLPEGLTENAIKAAIQMRFKPAMQDGVTVATRLQVEFSFALALNESELIIALQRAYPLMSEKAATRLAKKLGNGSSEVWSGQVTEFREKLAQREKQVLSPAEFSEMQTLIQALIAGLSTEEQALIKKVMETPPDKISVRDREEHDKLFVKGMKKMPAEKLQRLKDLYNKAVEKF